jgi:FkbM family methyltransferase
MAAAAMKTEQLGTMAQDYIASYLLCRLCRPGKSFVDVGAHIGSVTSAVQKHCPKSSIIAIEAMPEKAIALSQRYPKVKVLNFAVGDVEGDVDFFVDTERSGYSSLSSDRLESARVNKIRIPLRTLDGLLSWCDKIDVIKIDVEGAEFRVLLGCGETVALHRPVIMFESVLGSPADLIAIFDWFADRSYRLLAPNRVAHNGDSLSQSAFIDSHSYPRAATNYFAIPNERTEEIRDLGRKILSIRL